MSTRVRIEGLKELGAQLEKLDLLVQRRLRRQTLRAGAQIIEKKAKEYCPKDKGGLEESIHIEQVKRLPKYEALQVITGEGYFRGDTYYGAFVEFGHFVGPRKLKDKRRFQPAQPFMRPAADESVDEVVAVAINILQSGIELEMRL